MNIKWFLDRFFETPKIGRSREFPKEGHMKLEKKPVLFTKKHGQRLIVLIFLIATSYFLLPDTIFFSETGRYVGEVVNQNIISPIDINVPDEILTARVREEVQKEQPAVFDFDFALASIMEKKITSSFNNMRQFLKDNPGAASSAQRRSEDRRIIFEDMEKEFQITLGVPLSHETLSILLEHRYSPEIEKIISDIVRETLKKGVVSGKKIGETYKGVILQIIGEDRKLEFQNVDALIDELEIPEYVNKIIETKYASLPEDIKLIVQRISNKLIIPNVTFNKSESALLKTRAAEGVKPVFFRVSKGEVIVQDGEMLDSRAKIILDEINKYTNKSLLYEVIAGLFLIVTIILYVFYIDIKRYKPGVLDNTPKLFLLSILLLGTIIISKFFHFLLISFAAQFHSIEPSTIIYGVPVAIGAMLVSILFDIHMAIVFSFIISLLMGILISENSLFIFFSFIGNIVAAFSVIKCKRRTGLLKAGLLVGIANVMMLIAIDLYKIRLFTNSGMMDIMFGFSGGLLLALVGSSILPLLESLFDVTTDIKLLELMDLNQPLLRNLLISAPGTYHHSMMVANLAESAAESIGENTILARVAAYYHDIGKIVNPEYYIENQMGTLNRHDNLTPHISSLIVISHVKEGVEIGKRYNLPKQVKDVITQHHGARLIKFFYEKAKSAHPQVPVSEEDFRYSGPKPQSKIAAIVMLSDVMEASSRVLADPSPSRIATLVDKVISECYLDKQLDMCDMTVKDLGTIKESFVKTLTSIFHRRIEYPGVKYYEGEAAHEGVGGEQQQGKVKPKDNRDDSHGSVANVKLVR